MKRIRHTMYFSIFLCIVRQDFFFKLPDKWMLTLKCYQLWMLCREILLLAISMLALIEEI